jgi:prophage maintenance system killer protein
MDFVFYLSYEDIIQIHADVVADSGGGTGVRLEAGIHSAVSRKKSYWR